MYSITFWRVGVTIIAVATQQFILCFSHYLPQTAQFSEQKENIDIKCVF